MTSVRKRTNLGRLALLLPLLWFASLALAESQLERFSFLEPQMGVPFRIILFAPDKAQAEQAAKAAFDRVEALNRVLSNYETDSELSQLGYRSGQAGWSRVSGDLFRILTHAQRLSQRSQGAFDLTIGPLAASWRNARRTKTFPQRDQLERFQARVGWQHLKLDYAQGKVLLSKAGMRLDPGGIAKGDALDQALLTLRQQGISQALVAGAGDIAVSDPPPNQSAWRIQLSEFDAQADDLPAVVHLQHQAIATSGDLYQYVEIDGIRYSHIVDARTGLGLTERRLVTVISPRGIDADSLATAFSIVPFDQIESILAYYPDTSIRILRIEGEITAEYRFGTFPSP